MTFTKKYVKLNVQNFNKNNKKWKIKVSGHFFGLVLHDSHHAGRSPPSGLLHSARSNMLQSRQSSHWGRLCVYINDAWCRDAVVACKYCSPLVELTVPQGVPAILSAEGICCLYPSHLQQQQEWGTEGTVPLHQWAADIPPRCICHFGWRVQPRRPKGCVSQNTPTHRPSNTRE